MGKLLWLFVLTLSLEANAGQDDQIRRENIPIPAPALRHVNELKFDNFFGKVDYDKQTMVLTTTLINHKKPVEDFMFSGRFSPTATAYLKPINNSKYKAFVQVRCLDHYCHDLAINFGIRSKIGNPYAIKEQKFVVRRSDI